MTLTLVLNKIPRFGEGCEFKIYENRGLGLIFPELLVWQNYVLLLITDSFI